MIGLIVAYTKNRVIGSEGRIPWRIKGEQRRFKELTTGNVVIMGRKSYEEIGHPLPNRYTVVVSSTADYEAENCITVNSLPAAIKKAEELCPGKNIYISGGAGIYKEGIALAEKLFVTEIDAEIEGDTYFPEFDVSAYERTVEEIVDGEIPYSYVTYSKKKTKIFIDGSEGTTGLRINERFAGRDDLEILQIDPALRKDTEERKKLINASDITILCLPDAAAKEAVSLVENENVRILDASTAHRTEEGWAYGFPELAPSFREKIKTGKRVAVPGCYASGFIALMYPLVKEGILSADYPACAFAMSGYSGGGKKMIAEYEAEERAEELSAPREYALSQQHKHLKEMKAVPGLAREPLFSPIVCDYYSGMLVSLPIQKDFMQKALTPEELQAFFAGYYANEPFIKVNAFGAEAESRGFLSANVRSGWDGMEIFVTGNEDRMVVSSRFDNLGKGASGAAVQCLNIMLGCAEDKGLVL